MAYTPTVDDMDVNFDGYVNIPGDAVRIAQLATQGATTVGTNFVYDVNRDGVINFTLDVIPVAQYATTHTGTELRSRYHGRNPYKQPFIAGSIWNTPLGNSATRVATSFHQPTVTFHEDDYLIFAPGVPGAGGSTVWDCEDGWSGASRCTRTAGQGSIFTGVPLPNSYTIAGASQGDTPNNSAAILYSDRRTLYQCQPLTHCTTTSDWTAISGEASTTASGSSGHQDIFSHGIFGVHGGSGLSAIGGCVRLHELVPGGKIPHAIRWVLSSDEFSPTVGRFGGAGWRYPAIKCDSAGSGQPTGRGGAVPSDYTGTNIRMMPGTLLALKTTFVVGNLLTEPGQIIATAMKNYGGYVCDAGFEVASDARHPWYFGSEAGPQGSVRTNFATYWPTIGGFTGAESGDWLTDIQTIVANLEIIDDNGPATSTGTATNVTATSMADASNDWWKFYDLTGGVITLGGKTATITSNAPDNPTLNFTGGWSSSPPPAVGSYSIAWSGYTHGGSGTRIAPVAAAI